MKSMGLNSVRSFTFLFALLLLCCERQIPVTTNDSTEGYQIAGRVTDQLGNPISGVQIKLYYDFQYVDSNPPPSMDFEVTNAFQVIKVNVYDRENKVVRTLYNSTYPVGTMWVVWDKKDAAGRFVPSSVYTVHYMINDESRKSYPVTVNETVTAITDSTGAFVIPDKYLPVGFYPVPLYITNSSEYLGQHRITNQVALEFITPVWSRAVLVLLSAGTISRVNVTLD